MPPQSIISRGIKEIAMRKLLPILAILVFIGSSLAFASSYQNVSGVATSLAANGTNCAAGQASKGIDASGNAEGCSDSISGNAGTVTNGVYTTGAGTVFLAPNGDGTALTNVIHTEVDPTVDTSAEIQALIGAGVYDASGAASGAVGTHEGTYNHGLIATALQSESDPQVDVVTSGNFCKGTGTTVTCNDSNTYLTTVDVSDNTNLTGGRSLSMNGDAVDADNELYNKIANISIQNPVDTMDGIVQLKFATAVTITRVSCSVDSGTATIQLDERGETTPDTAGTDVMSSTLACDTDMQGTTTFDNASIAADAPLNLDIDATSGTPTKFRLHVEYTVDD